MAKAAAENVYGMSVKGMRAAIFGLLNNKEGEEKEKAIQEAMRLFHKTRVEVLGIYKKAKGENKPKVEIASEPEESAVVSMNSEEGILATNTSEDIPKADREGDFKGFFYKEGKRYATVSVWCVKFLSKVSSHKTIRKFFIQRFGCGIDGIDAAGNFRQQAFYSEAQAEIIFSEILSIPCANRYGSFLLNGEEYCHAAALADLFSIDRSAMLNRLKHSGISGIDGRLESVDILSGGFYNLCEVKEKVCADLIENLPQVDLDGFVEINGEVFGYVKSLARFFGIDRATINRRINEAGLEGKRGRDVCDRVVILYPRDKVAKILNTLGKPKVDSNGMVVIDGEKYYMMNELTRILGSAKNTIKRRIKKDSLPFREALDRQGKLIRVYDIKLFKVDALVSIEETQSSGLEEFLAGWKEKILETVEDEERRISIERRFFGRAIQAILKDDSEGSPLCDDEVTSKANIDTFAEIFSIDAKLLREFFSELKAYKQ